MILFSRLNILFVAGLLILQTLPSNALPPDLPEGDIVFISHIVTQDLLKKGRSKDAGQFHLNVLNLQTQKITQRYPIPFNQDYRHYSPVFTVLPDQKRIWINSNSFSSELKIVGLEKRTLSSYILKFEQKIVNLEERTISSYTPKIEESFENFSIPLTGAHHEYTILYREKTPYLYSNEKLKLIPYEKKFHFALMLPTPNQALFVDSDANTIDIVDILTGKHSQVKASMPIDVKDCSITPNGEILTILGDNMLLLKNLKDGSESTILIKGEGRSESYTKIIMISDRYGIVAGRNSLYLLDTHEKEINPTEIFRTESKNHYISGHGAYTRPFLAFIPRPQKTLFNKSNIGEIPSLSDLEIHTVQ